jgi:hypothetical protein
MDAADWTAVGSTAFAAVAAGASWATVLQTRRERIAALKPNLHYEVIYLTGPQRCVQLSISNNGGAAKNVYFCVITGNEVTYGFPQPTAFFKPGEGRLINTDLTSPESLMAQADSFVACHDASGARLYLFTTDKAPRVFRLRGWRRSRKGFAAQDLARKLFPGADLEKLTWKTYQTAERTT